MKKTIFIFLTLFIFIPSFQALSKFHISEKVPNMYIETVRDIGIHNGVPFIIRRDDGSFVYCLERPKDVNENEYYKEYYYNDELFNLTDEQLKRINLLSFYGYQYSDHTDVKWYGVTQFLIWKTLYKDIYFTDTKDGNKITAYEEEIKEIETLVDNYLTLPSFANINYDLTIDTEFIITDNNKVINNYEVQSSDIEAYIQNNKLYVKSKEPGDYELILIRKSPIERDYILYGLTDSQSLIYPGRVDNMEFKVNIKFSSGSITINKIDSENEKRNFATLEGAEYGIYDISNKLITTIKTDKNGIAFIDKLIWYQPFYIKELIPSPGYKLDEKTYQIVLSKNLRNAIVDSYAKVIEGNLKINKYYCEEENCQLEDGAIFEIYDINNNLIGAYETENGIINVKLEYGEYYGIQTNGISGYNFVDKFNISIKEEKDYIIDLYSEKEREDILIVEVPDTKKIDYEIFIPIIFIVLGLILIFKSLKRTTK